MQKFQNITNVQEAVAAGGVGGNPQLLLSFPKETHMYVQTWAWPVSNELVSIIWGNRSHFNRFVTCTRFQTTLIFKYHTQDMQHIISRDKINKFLQIVILATLHFKIFIVFQYYKQRENSLVFHVIFLLCNSHSFVIGVTLNDILDWFLDIFGNFTN